MNLTDLLGQLMRPPGDGIPSFSAGKGASLGIQQKVFGLLQPHLTNGTEAQLYKAWKQSWFELNRAKVVLIGVPLDTGAGIRRGAAYGPRALRETLLQSEEYQELLRRRTVIDLGDIFVNPHLLHDEMLSDDQILRCQTEMYASAPETVRKKLAVSALSQTEQVVEHLLKEYGHLKIFILGGDHSVAWPISKCLAKKYEKSLGIVQPDAHTDLLPSRLGVKYCFGTWSFHAKNLLGSPAQMVQVGIRQSGQTQSHWEATCGVRQFWSEEILKDLDGALRNIISHLKSTGVKQIYFSNDIDGTDENEVAATGTPVGNGPPSSFFFQLIEALAENFELVAADLMEVAPDLARSPEELRRTLDLGCSYILACLRVMK